MEALALAVHSGSAKGGTLLELLYDRYLTFGGDAESQKLYLYFFQKASEPYFAILEKWVYKGIIDDPYKEFMIAENQKETKEDLSNKYTTTFWDTHFHFRPEMRLPDILNSLKDSILVTGKYFNVLRECGLPIQHEYSKRLSFVPGSHELEETLRAVHQYASQAVLNLLMQEKGLKNHLKIMQHYFFASYGDYLIHFADLSREELAKPIKEINSAASSSKSKLQSFLELSLKSSVGANNPLTDHLTLAFSEHTVMEQILRILHVDHDGEVMEKRTPPPSGGLRGHDTVMIDYKVEWPVSIVLNRPNIFPYQLIFRYLFQCRQVEQQLCSTWTEQKIGKAFLRGQQGAILRGPFFLRQQMLTFMQTIQYYTAFDVLEPQWQAMELQLAKASTLDEVILVHSDFLQACLTDSMLTEAPLVLSLEGIMATCVNFVRLMTRLNQNFSHRLQQKSSTAPMVDAGFEKELAILEQDFRTKFTEFIAALNDVMAGGRYVYRNLVQRLDYSGFYAGIL